MEVGSDVSAVDLVADVPMRVVVPGVSARVEFWVFVLGDGVVCEAELDLGGGLGTLSNFCSWVSSFSKFLGTETLVFHCFLRSPRWSGSMSWLISSLMVRASRGMSSLEKNCSSLS